MKGNRDREINEILNAALSSYSAESPGPGFEQRVFNRVKYDVGQPRASWLRPALIVLASACLLLVIVSLPALRKPAANPSIAVAGTKPFQALPSMAATIPLKVSEPSKPVRKHKRPGTETLADRRHSLPKLATFPSPVPLTNEEHALLVLATSRPQDVPKLLVRNSNPDEQSIQIEPITIKPL
jgi:hypothetical protein